MSEPQQFPTWLIFIPIFICIFAVFVLMILFFANKSCYRVTHGSIKPKDSFPSCDKATEKDKDADLALLLLMSLEQTGI